MTSLHDQGVSRCSFIFKILILFVVAFNSHAKQSNLAMIEPKQAVMLAADAAPSGVPGIFSLRVIGTGSQGDFFFLNSESDYRDQRNLTVAITSNAAAEIKQQLGQNMTSAFFLKQIFVKGYAKRVKIFFTDSDKKFSDKYYYQTHVLVTKASQIRIDNYQLLDKASVSTKRLSRPIPPIPPREPPRSFEHLPPYDVYPKECGNCAAWNAPRVPFKIYGNSYYVGVDGLSSVLITSENGHILIDGGLPQSAELIAKNIKQLGFSIKDVKWLLNSHAHYDHVGGLAALQRMSGAKIAASEDSAQAMKTGSALANDPQAGNGEAMNFPAISNISVITDGERIGLGKKAVTATFTPGHSPGGTTWSWQSCEASKCVTLVFADSLSSVSDDTYQFSAHPEYLARFKKSIETVSGLKCDIIIAAHPSFSSLFEKAQANRFIDENSCKKYAENARQNLEKRLAQELQN